MLQSTGSFASAIKESMREVGVTLAYLRDGEVVYLEGTDIQTLNYTSQTNKGLGGVVTKVVDSKLMYNANTSTLKRGDFFNLFYTCADGKCKADIFYINQLKSNRAKTVITMQAVDLLTFISDNTTPPLPMERNTDLKSYMISVLNHLGYPHNIGAMVNPSLSLGYPKSANLSDTLGAMAEAAQCIINFRSVDTFGVRLPFFIPTFLNQFTINDVARVDVRPFKVSTPVDVISPDQLIDYEIDDDSSDQYNDVRVSLFFPSSTQQKILGQVNVTVPGNVSDYNIGTVEFGNTTIPQICKFNSRVDISGYTLGSDKCNIRVNNSDVLPKNLDAEFIGMDINENTLSNTDSDGNIKVVSNMYIQSAAVYDTKIFRCPNGTIKYFGNPLYEVGDTIEVDGDKVLIVEHTLRYTGGLKGTIKGVVMNV